MQNSIYYDPIDLPLLILEISFGLYVILYFLIGVLKADKDVTMQLPCFFSGDAKVNGTRE